MRKWRWKKWESGQSDLAWMDLLLPSFPHAYEYAYGYASVLMCMHVYTKVLG